MLRKTREQTYDGVICFGGGDWWYHNRGHYDMQMMRQFSRHLPVIHVNSNGVRVPRLGEGRMFLRRVTRKLRSLARGFVRVSDRFGVLSPRAIPGPLGWRYSRRLIAAQVQLAARRMGIRRPLIWITCPPAAQLLRYFPERPLVYQRTDRWECFPGCDPDQIRGYHARLSSAATVTLFCSRLLLEEEAAACCDALFVDHGVDFEAFVSAGDGQTPEPTDMADIPRPRVGFIGGIDSHTFDPELFRAVAGRLSEAQFVLVGSSSLPADWCRLPNVSLLGQKPYEQVAAYMAACDVLIMPWNRNPWIQACNPVKLKEYLAVGRPVVSTEFAELKHYPAVRTANDADAFAAQIRAALAEGCDVAAQRDQVRGHTWDAKSAQVIQALERNGWTVAGAAPSAPGAFAADESIEQRCQARYST